MSHYAEYTLQLVGDAVPQEYRRLPPSEFLLIRICLRQRAHFNESVEESPENVGVFPLLPEILLSDDSARMILSPCLSYMGIPTHHHEHPIDQITSFYRRIGASVGDETPTITANILMETWTWVSNDETEAVTRLMEESMEVGMFRPVPATKSSIEALDKVRLDGSGSREQCMICLGNLCDGQEAIRMPCSHIYHGDCIVQWLETSHLCPLCRFQMPT